MGRLDAFTDMTGKMNQMDVNTQNIQQILDEMNRNSDQLDALNNNLSVVSSGKVSVASTGVPIAPVVVNHGLGFPPAVLAFYTLSTESNSIVHQLPAYILDGSGNFLYYVIFYATTNNLEFDFFFNGAGPTTTFNFSYYLLKQPANLTVISL